ncbi:hypothetical protein DNTS_032629 [Danionella cerebrum]|uniref:Uncharacterized protein n=1 Tax=Danionella cerebrum TaxID=2873325 RepID=A0A553QYF4_9TELE|nr:hypothetical protein DNTS_032629 [Danionella translucida]
MGYWSLLTSSTLLANCCKVPITSSSPFATAKFCIQKASEVPFIHSLVLHSACTQKSVFMPKNGLWKFLCHQHECDSWRTEEPSPDDEKRRNYGGVYVGLPADLTTVAVSQSKSTRKGEPVISCFILSSSN